MTFPNLRIAAVIALCAAGLAACEPRISRHGKVLDLEAVASIEPGVASQVDVVRLLGTPSSRSLFGEDTWFYISQQRSTQILSLPHTDAQTVVAVAFDDEGVVEEFAMLTIEDGLPIDPVARSTPTHGRELGLLEQLLGNIGRFDTTGPVPDPAP